MPIYWNLTLIYTLPFFFTFMLFKNGFDLIWCLNGLISLTLLILVSDWISSTILLQIGIGAAWAYYTFSVGESPQLPDSIYGILASYLGMLIYIGLFVHKEGKIQQEKLMIVKSFAGSIAHEMRTPFLGIRSSAKAIKKYLPQLIESYTEARDAGLNIQPITEENLQNLMETPEDLHKITLSASLVIDMLLMNLKETPSDNTDFKLHSIKECIDETLQNYPFTEDEEALITCQITPNFIFYGNKILVKHILFNLIKNALYYIKVADKGSILLWSESTKKENILYFKDTGSGISDSVLPHIFDCFYTQTHHGTGIGLSFCQSAMKTLGGSITCNSIEGDYTTFILRFPIAKIAEVH